MMNVYVGIGRITSKPILHKSKIGTTYCRFNLAINYPGKSKSADFIPCIIFNKLAEGFVRRFDKGYLVHVQGKMKSFKYTVKDDLSINMLTLNIEELELLAKPNANDGYVIYQRIGSPADEYMEELQL